MGRRMAMKRLSRRVAWCLLFGCLWLPVFDDPPLHTGAYVQAVTGNAATVCLVTAAAESLSLTVRDESGRFAREVPAQDVRRHEFELSGLSPATSYHYTVLDAAQRARAAGSFRTPPADDATPVRFAVVGDSGKSPWWVWLQRNALFHLPAAWDWLPTSPKVTAIGARIAQEQPDFLLHVGDIVYPTGMQGHYSSAFFRPFAPVLLQAPVFATLGNHDVLEDTGRQALANFRAPPDDFTGDGRFYAVVWGSVRVIVLDLNPPAGKFVEDGAAAAPDPDAERHPAYEFLRRQLEAATEPWLVVASHYPILSASRQRDQPDLQKYLLPLLQRHAVDLYLCGHDHAYQRFELAGGPTMVVTGGGGKSLYPIVAHPNLAAARSEFNYCTVQVRGASLVLEGHAQDGSVFDTLAMDKKAMAAEADGMSRLSAGRAARIRALLQ